MKEMIERLIADGWETVTIDDMGAFVYLHKKPTMCVKGTFISNGDFKVPSCLFPDITFENSPVELKTLLVDDEEQDNIQREIKMLIVWKFEYLLKQGNGEVHAYNSDGTECRNANRLKNFVPEVHEKVYLKDILKKRKIKKSVWVAVDENGVVRVANEKPIRGDGGIWVDTRGYAIHHASKHTNLLPFSWEDEPKQITIEVEE